MKCSLHSCKNEIPKTRNGNARHCSEECSYAAKKERSKKRYATIKAPADELKRCEQILAYFYSILQLNKQVIAEDLQLHKFNFSICSGEHLDNKRLFKIIGIYLYYIDTNKNLLIWKLL